MSNRDQKLDAGRVRFFFLSSLHLDVFIFCAAGFKRWAEESV